jgi:hypothetical protein
MIRFPFFRELNGLFTSDRHAIWKILAGGAVGALVGARVAFRRDSPFSRGEGLMIVLCATVISLILVMLLLLRDVIAKRLAMRQPVNPLLKWYVGKGFASVLLWIVTIFAIAIIYALFLDLTS